MRTTTTPDRRLVHAARAGDEAAFEELYLRYRDVVHRICLKRLRDCERAEEATQETFARVLARLDRFEGGDLISHYITRTARFTAIDHAATVHRRPEELRGTTDYADVDDQDAKAELENVDRQIDVGSLLVDLRDNHRDLLVDHHMDGTPLALMAERLSSTSGSIAVRLHRARAAARRLAEARGLGRLVPLPVLTRIRSWGNQYAVGATHLALGVAVAIPAVLGAPRTLPTSQPADRPAAVTAPQDVMVPRASAADDDRDGRGPGRRTMAEDQRSDAAAGSDSTSETGEVERLAKLPEAQVPLAGRRGHQDAPPHPDHEIAVSAHDEVDVAVLIDDEPTVHEPVRRGCPTADALPTVSCESRPPST